ncbi:MAG TPA: transcriptional regulator [Candidatus Hydrogenedentes bacterium]|nr:transcriptional regulator [Candidatus Hydrogenedentota bacterium]HOJ68479.1 transcriptional regulator [Candidatus Hydrogenedentota bacterium]HOK90697.1 transcriptional regulator [Candidatus Hydrogenedentota bacterium]HOV60785.1 transcriptional regulator [Candidatus Hydrogenedentota bacterium]HPO30617.1 transcriptional regulator [Candidatus Hydrogenedentota bacterium]
MKDLDRVIHEPARLRILTLLAGLEAADFMFLLTTTGLTKGNLSSHMDKLEKAGYVSVRKTFMGRVPHTEYAITPEGAAALERHWRELDEIRNLRQPPESQENAST